MVPGFLLLVTEALAVGPPQCAQVGGAGTCFRTQAIKRLTGVDGAGCCVACSQNPGCGAWELMTDPEGGAGTCALKAPSSPQGPCSNPNIPNTSASGTSSGPPSPSPPSPSPPSPPSNHGLAFDHMFIGGAVLQMGVSTSVWGWGATSSTVSVAINGKVAAHAIITGGEPGNQTWRATLPPQPKGFGLNLSVASGGCGEDCHVTIPVAFGVVIMCSGQSNMGMAGASTPNVAGSR